MMCSNSSPIRDMYDNRIYFWVSFKPMQRWSDIVCSSGINYPWTSVYFYECVSMNEWLTRCEVNACWCMLPGDGPELVCGPFCVEYVMLTWLGWGFSTDPKKVEPDMFCKRAIRLWYWAGVISRPDPSVLFFGPYAVTFCGLAWWQHDL